MTKKSIERKLQDLVVEHLKDHEFRAYVNTSFHDHLMELRKLKYVRKTDNMWGQDSFQLTPLGRKTIFKDL